jgi:hypothetical protein
MPARAGDQFGSAGAAQGTGQLVSSAGSQQKGVATRKVDWRRDRHHVLGMSALASGAGESRSAATDSAQLAEIASGHIWACCTVDSVERQTQARSTLGAEERVAIAATTVEDRGWRQ